MVLSVDPGDEESINSVHLTGVLDKHWHENGES